jgi:hypothetical protein
MSIMQKIFSLLCLVALFASQFCVGQQDSISKISTFKISAVDFSIFPRDNYLFLGQDNHIQVTPTVKSVKFTCKVTNGTIALQKDGSFVIKNNLPVATLLSIYTKDVNGKEHLAATKPYTFVPFPNVKISNVRSDSSATHMTLAIGNFSVKFKDMAKIPVISFKMEILKGNEILQEPSSGGKLSKKMLQYIGTLKPGAMLYFSDFKYITSDGHIKTEPIYRVFLVKDDPNPIQFKL